MWAKARALIGPHGKKRLGDLLCLRLSPSRIEEFLRWRQDNLGALPDPFVVSFDNWQRSTDRRTLYRTWEAEQLRQQRRVWLGIQNESGIGDKLDFAAELSGLDFSKSQQRLVIDRNIRQVTLHQGMVTIKNCFIEELTLNSALQSLDVSDCTIGTLILYQTFADPIRFVRSTVLGIRFMPRPDGILGNVVLQRVFMPRDNLLGTINVQTVRNLRQHLLDHNNRLAAGVLHSVELAHERPHERWPSRVISYIYEVGSDFGNSTVRPAGWLFFSLLSVTVIAAAFDLVSVGANGLHGWQEKLGETDWWHRLFRSFIYAGQSILNPLGIFASRSLVIAKTELAALFLTPLSLIGTLAVILLLISIRRRFKLE